MAAPTLLNEYEGSWNATGTPRSITGVTMTAGDLLVAYAVGAGYDGVNADLSIGQIGGTAVTWTQVQATKVNDYCNVVIWTATAPASQTIEVTISRGSTFIMFGGAVLRFDPATSAGFGASAKANAATGTPQVTFSTTGNDSAIVVINGDWNAVDGTTRPVVDIGGATESELTYFRDAANYTVYVELYDNVGAAGSKTVGWTGPSGQKWAIAAIEITGTGASATIDQEGFRFGEDDGSESAHTFREAQDANTTAPLNANLLLRLLLNATGDPAGAAYSLRAQKNGAGGYTDVPLISSGPGDITFVGAGAQAVSNTTGANVTAAWPAGYTAVADDVAILVAAGRHNNGTSLAPSTPSGWTLIDTRFREVGAVDVQVTAWIRKLTAAEAAPQVTVPSNYGGGGTANGMSAQVAVWRGVDATTPQDATAVPSDGAAAATWTPTGITTVTNKAVVVSIVASADDNALGLLSGSEQGFTARMSGGSYDTTTGSDHAVGMADKVQTTAGAVTNPTWQETLVGNDAWCAITVALRPATITNGLYVAASANIAAGGEATTARLTAPAGKTTGDFTTGRRWDDENGTDSIDIVADQYTEVEWCLQAQSPSLNGDFYDFRVYSGGSPLSTYTVTPRWTIGTPAGPTSYPAITTPSAASRLARLMSF